ncbi:MAG: ureidoglycolate lyase [Pseudomonadota bacterium]
MITLAPEPLTRAAFAPFGDVIETAGAAHFVINEGTTTRFHALTEAATGPEGTAILSIFRGRRRPLTLTMMERHPLGSQAFMPLSDEDWLVVVAPSPEPSALRCFRATGDQGVSYFSGIWHHPLLVLCAQQDFLVVDRQGPGENLEERMLSAAVEIEM